MNEMYMYEGMEEAMEFGIAFGLITVVIYLLCFVWGIVAYVLQSLGMYTIASRRQIRHPWMAWVPVLSTYLLGCISDQYQHVVNKRNTKRRVVLLVCMILFLVVYIGLFASTLGMIFDIMGSPELMKGYASDEQMMEMVMAPLLSILGWSFVMMIVAIVLAVFQYVALYDLYASCWPNCKVGFLLLTIFLGVATPILVFICRKKDEGMVPVQHPVYPQYASPAPQPEAPAPAPQQPAEDKEPWE